MKKNTRKPRGVGKHIKCEHCGYKWRTVSELEWVSCPNCAGKVKIARCLIE